MVLAASRKYLEIINIKNNGRFEDLWSKHRSGVIFNYTRDKHSITDSSFVAINRIHYTDDNEKIKRIIR